MRTTPASCGTNSRTCRVRLSWKRKPPICALRPLLHLRRGLLRGLGLEQDDSVGLDGLAFADGAEALVGLGLDADAVERQVEQAREGAADALLPGSEVRPLGDDDRIDV